MKYISKFSFLLLFSTCINAQEIWQHKDELQKTNRHESQYVIDADTEWLHDTIPQTDSIVKSPILKGLTMGYFKGAYSIEATANVCSVKLYMHIPIIHRETSPVFFRMLETYPPGKIVKYGTVNKGIDNRIAEVTFGEMHPADSVTIPWECWTLKKNSTFSDMPSYVDKATLDALDDSLDAYLQPSSYIQSDHSNIVAKAAELAGTENNILQIAGSVILFTGKTIAYESYGAQDALTTLTRGYSVCTGKANLAVALFRALKIPARVLMVAFTHYIVEFYLPGYGWVRGESTLGNMPVPVQYHTIMLACTAQEENYSGYSGVMCYWGTSNDNVWFDIEYSQAQKNEEAHHITVDDTSALHAINKTKTVWRKYNRVLNEELSTLQQEVFTQALQHQEDAVTSFANGNLDDYLIHIQSAGQLYDQIESMGILPDITLTDFYLRQNYPNPFNSTTTFCFHLPMPSFVTLKVVDLLGREIETLISGHHPAGEYRIRWTAEDLPSGLYIYRLKTGEFEETKKLILQK
jgi:transglutaminase-like putative cysteine protease